MTENAVVPDAAQNTAVDIVNAAIVGRMAPTASNVHTLSFSELIELDSHVIDGFTEVDKSEMLGVPHVITAMTFWYPKKDQRGFVSVECTAGDANALETALRRGWIPNKTMLSELMFSPNERVLYNDGSTGIRRQIVEILESARLLDVGNRDITDRSRFDKTWLEWESFSQTATQGKGDNGDTVVVPSFRENVNGQPLLIIVPRGLHVSQYSNDHTDEGETYFLR